MENYIVCYTDATLMCRTITIAGLTETPIIIAAGTLIYVNSSFTTGSNIEKPIENNESIVLPIGNNFEIHAN